MWVFEEFLAKGQKLSEVINTEHENVKYLPGFKIPENVIAVTDIVEAVKDATLLIFVVPHQFVDGICEKLKGNLHPDARAISLIKGLDCTKSGIELVSSCIRKSLGVNVSVLMGANLAIDIAKERFSEATIGYTDHDNAVIWKDLFEKPYFRISLIKDATGVELCGALKNIVAVAAGFVDGLYPKGESDNTKSAVIRRGLLEMQAFCHLIDDQVKNETFLESCGLADVITSSFGGRNRRVAEEFVRSEKSLDELEAELLNGQKLQGPLTSKEVYKWISERNLSEQFPIFSAVYKICYEGLDPSDFLNSI